MNTQQSPSPAMEFLVDALKRNPKASYADLKAKADERKLKVFPIMYGRAQTLTGIVKMPKRGEGKGARARAIAGSDGSTAPRGRQPDANSKSGQVRALLAQGMSAGDIAERVGCTTALVYNIKSTMSRGGGDAPARRGPGRPRTTQQNPTSSVEGLAGIVDMVKSADRERAKLRAALERIQNVIADALA